MELRKFVFLDKINLFHARKDKVAFSPAVTILVSEYLLYEGWSISN